MQTAARTAISRISPSAPTTWLAAQGLLNGRVLDYGCGRGFDCAHYGFIGYDPFWRVEDPGDNFDTIICQYVLNVLRDPIERQAVVDDVMCRLGPDGIAYFVVRRDLKKSSLRKNGSWQGLIYLNPAQSIHHAKNRYEIYAFRSCCANNPESQA